MQIIETFGHYVENLTNTKPENARWLLKTGWDAQNLKFRFMQDKRLMPADRHLANLMMDTMLRPLSETGGFCYCKYFYTLRNDGGSRITSL